MRQPTRSKNKYLTDREIELFCQSIKETLIKINERIGLKKVKKQQKKSW